MAVEWRPWGVVLVLRGRAEGTAGEAAVPVVGLCAWHYRPDLAYATSFAPSLRFGILRKGAGARAQAVAALARTATTLFCGGV
jgi:hypothetical protein